MNRRSVYLLTLLVLAPVLALAQDVTASVTGVVHDPSGLAVSGAHMLATRVATGATFEAVSDSTGTYSMRALPVGDYTLTVQATGFQKFIAKGIHLEVNDIGRVDVSLTVGSLGQTITVTDSAQTVDTVTPTLKTVVDQARIEELPLNGRNSNQLMALVVGVTSDPAANVTSGTTYGSGLVASGVSVNGSRSNSTNYVLDGAQNNDSYSNAPNPSPNPDALQEFSVQTNNFSAEFGRQAGGVVNAVTKSGTNQLHGTGFEYVRNYDFNAANYFNPSGPNGGKLSDGLKRNQFGATVGGPIFIPKLYDGRNKTFFFLSYQGTDILQTPFSGKTFVPTAAERAGNFSAIAKALKDPLTGVPLPGNQLPPSELSPISAAILNSYIPLPTSGNYIFTSAPNNLYDHQLMAKLDQQITEKNRLTARYFRSWAKQLAYLNPTDILATTSGGNWYDLSTAVIDTHIFTPTLLNEALFSYNRTDGYFDPVQPSKSLQQLGVNYWAPPTYKYEIYIDGYFNINTGDTNSFPRHEYQYLDTVRWTKGRNQISMGGEFEKGTGTINNNYPGNGLFTFDASAPFTGDALADFISGHLYNIVQGVGQYKNNEYNRASLFFQDSIKLLPHLTADVGIRWEPFLPYTDDLNRLAVWEPGKQSTRYPNAPAGVLYAGDPGIPKGVVPIVWHNFAPRLGLAWDVFGNGKTSFRAGYGVFYDYMNTIATNNSSTQAPFGTTVTNFGNTANSFSNPYGGTVNPFPQSLNPPSSFVFPAYTSQALFDSHFRNPYVQAWNATLEQQVKGGFILRTSYAASKGTRLLIDTQLNPAVYQAGATTSTTNQRRIYAPALGSTQLYQSVGNSTFNALQVSAERRFRNGFTLLANYQFSKSLDDASANKGTGINRTNPFNQAFDKGPSDFDRPNVAHISAIYALPIHPKNPVERFLIGGWTIDAIMNFTSGYPFTVLSGKDNALTGQGSQRASLSGISPYYSGSRSLNQIITSYLNPAAFITNATGTYGTLGRNTYFGPNSHNIDAGLFKDFPITEHATATLRFEVFNATNAINLGQPSSTLTSSTFMQITSAAAPRIVQLAGRIKW